MKYQVNAYTTKFFKKLDRFRHNKSRCLSGFQQFRMKFYKAVTVEDPDDPYLHICVAHGIPVLKRFFLLPKCLKGKHVGSPGVSIYRCRKIEILSSRPKFLHVDGELVGPAQKAVVRLEETKIRMVY